VRDIRALLGKVRGYVPPDAVTAIRDLSATAGTAVTLVGRLRATDGTVVVSPLTGEHGLWFRAKCLACSGVETEVLKSATSWDVLHDVVVGERCELEDSSGRAILILRGARVTGAHEAPVRTDERSAASGAAREYLRQCDLANVRVLETALREGDLVEVTGVPVVQSSDSAGYRVAAHPQVVMGALENEHPLLVRVLAPR
jgi:hypothetical protein